MRHYFMVEVMDGDIYLSEGKGADTDPDYDESEHWQPWQEIKSSNHLLTKVLELLKEGGCEK